MTQLFIGNRNVDLFEDETMLYTMALADFNNFGKSTAAYTNTFQVPATPNNNDIVRHYFEPEVTVSTTFDPRARINARIEVDSLPFQSGYVMTNPATYKNEKPHTYSFTFYSNDNRAFAALHDVTLKDLDWQSYNYNPNDEIIIREGMEGGSSAIGSIDNVIFPLVQLFNDGGGNKWTVGMLGANTIDYKRLRPAVRINYVFTLIEQQYGINFDTANMTQEDLDFFESIYLYLPYEYVPDDSLPPGYTEDVPIDTIAPEAGYSTDQVNLVDNVFNIDFIKQQSGVNSCSVTMNFQGFGANDYTIRSYTDTGTGFTLSDERLVNGPVSEDYLFDKNDPTLFLRFEIFSLDVGLSNGNYIIQGSSSNNDPTNSPFQTATGVLGQVEFVDPNTQFVIRVPNIKIVDFLNWIIKMLNLVMYSDDAITYYIDTWDNWRSVGDDVNLSQYIDIGEATRLVNAIPPTFEFKYEQSDAILNKGFRNLNGYDYGDIELYTRGVGQDVNIEVGYNMPLWENLGNDGTNDDILIFSCYDDKYDPLTEEMHLMCWKQDDNKTCNIQFSGWTLPISTYKVASSYHGVDAPTYGLPFDSEQNPYTNNTETVSLYGDFYQNYYGVLLDTRVRGFKYKGYVPNAIVSKLFPNDTVHIGNRTFIINKYQQNLTTQEISIELFNFSREPDDIIPPLVDNIPPEIGVLSAILNPDVTPPTSPSNLTYSDVGPNEFQINWDASTDTESGVRLYKIWVDDVNIMQIDAAQTNTWIYGRASLTTYVVKVSAMDFANNESGFSNEVSVTTTVDNAPVMTSTGTYFWQVPTGGSSHQLQLAATQSPNYFEDEPGTLPSFCTINNNTGVVSGTVTQADAGSYDCYFRASNDGGVNFGEYSKLVVVIQPI